MAEQLSDDRPVTRAELDTVLKAELEAFEQRILDRVQEVVRDAQTEILRGFEKYAAATGIRIRKLEADASNPNSSVEGRMAIMEDRITALEVRILRN